MTTRCLGCATLIPAGSRCPACERVINREKTARRNAATGGSGYAWQRIRAEVLARDGYRCALPAPHDGPLRVDHILPLSEGGTSAPANLRAICLDHHRALPTTRGGG